MSRWRIHIAALVTLVLAVSVYSITQVTAALDSHPSPNPSANTLTVTKTGDTNDGVCDFDCSLREAIAVAASGDEIVVPAGIYTLTSLFKLTIDKSLTVTGAGSGDTIIQAATHPEVADFLVLKITDGVVAISGVTVRHGNSSSRGGGIYNEAGSLTLTNSTISGNTAREGGGIYNRGTLTITNSTISDNRSTSDGSIYNTGTLTLANTTVSGNTADEGGGIYNTGTLTLANTTVSGNTTRRSGGIYNRGTVALTNSTISNNTAYEGGGISNEGILTLTNSTISGNTAREGGGINNRGTLTITNSTISANRSTADGGGIYNSSEGTLTITNSTISGNTADEGGGIYVLFGTFTLTNSTVSDNTASGVGGGIFAGYNSPVRVANTLIAGNTASIRPDCRGVLTSLGHNLIGDTTGCSFTPATGDLVNVDPMLGPLQDNGGDTFTHALLVGSPAIDGANPASPGSDETACPQTDQRGVERPADGDGDDIARCDIGAFELAPGSNFPPIAFDLTVSTSGIAPVAIELTGSDADPEDALTFIIVSLPSNGELFEGITGDKITTGGQVLGSATVTYIAQAGFVGSDSFGFKVNDGEVDSNIATVTVTVTEVTVQGAVALQGLSNPLTGAIVSFSSGNLVTQVTTDPQNGSFQLQLPTGTYNVKVEKDGFLRAHVQRLLVDRDLVLAELNLLWGDANGDGVDVTDLAVTGRNLGLDVSPWEVPVNEPDPQPEYVSKL